MTVTDEDKVARVILAEACMGCHDFSMLTRRPVAAGEWSGILGRMAGLGANISEDDRNRLERYLAKTYPVPDQTEAPRQPVDTK